MIYRDFQDLKLSALGLGTMRLPLIDGKYDQIDEAAAAEMFAYAMDRGLTITIRHSATTKGSRRL